MKSALYDHKFDIDNVIRALCGDDHTGRWLLSTRTGELVAETADSGHTQGVEDGDDDNHWHVITPLPTSFLTTLKTHPKLTALAPDFQQEVLEKLNGVNFIYELIKAMDESSAGGWIHGRLKDVAMDWLNSRNLIPPSMRHVQEDQLFPPSQTVKISIT